MIDAFNKRMPDLIFHDEHGACIRYLKKSLFICIWFLSMNNSQIRKGKATLNAKHEDFVNKFKQQKDKVTPTTNKTLSSLEKKIAKMKARKDNGEKLTATEHSQLFKMKKHSIE